MKAPPSRTVNPIVETYSRLADHYDDERNVRSCWGQASDTALTLLHPKADARLILDAGCGTGRALATLARNAPPGVRFVGIDPADNMRKLAVRRLRPFPNVRIQDGSFESIGLDTGSVDYLFSIMAFHWTTDPDAAVTEIRRVLTPVADVDLFFIGRHNGREFIQQTTPIFMKHMGPALLLESARMRKQLTKDEAYQLFTKAFRASELSIDESYHTYHDTLEGHWGWWVRIEGQFMQIPPARKEACDREVKDALARLAEPAGIPYTIHQLHVKVRRR
ncbi:MAG TPA: class I SAM-dependent methyltransferase [Gemmatimonadales bacterium]|nr:class I SAM-dependent methyltransferase [Gemmatimonadales bacterium]